MLCCSFLLIFSGSFYFIFVFVFFFFLFFFSAFTCSLLFFSLRHNDSQVVSAGEATSVAGLEVELADSDVTVHVQGEAGDGGAGAEVVLVHLVGLTDGAGATSLDAELKDWVEGGRPCAQDNRATGGRAANVVASNVADVAAGSVLRVSLCGGEHRRGGQKRNSSVQNAFNVEIVRGVRAQASDTARSALNVDNVGGRGRSGDAVDEVEAVKNDSDRVLPARADVDDVVEASVHEVDWSWGRGNSVGH